MRDRGPQGRCRCGKAPHFADGAADAPVQHLDDLLVGLLLHVLLQEVVIDAHLAELERRERMRVG